MAGSAGRIMSIDSATSAVRIAMSPTNSTGPMRAERTPSTRVILSWKLAGLTGAGPPAPLCVPEACCLAVRYRADGRPHLHLFMALDRWLGRAACLLAPHE